MSIPQKILFVRQCSFLFIGFPVRVFRRVWLKPFHERSLSLHSHLFFLMFCSKRELLKSEGFRSISFDVICFLILSMFPNCFCRRVSQRGSVINISERCYAPLWLLLYEKHKKLLQIRVRVNVTILRKKIIKNAFIFLLAFLKVPSQKWTVYSSLQSYSCAVLTKYVKPVNHVICFWIKLHPVQAIIFSRSVEGITWRRKPKGKAYLQYKFFWFAIVTWSLAGTNTFEIILSM